MHKFNSIIYEVGGMAVCFYHINITSMILFQLLPGFMLFVFCVYSFIRECKLDYLRYLEQDRLGDAHILREIEKFLQSKEAVDMPKTIQ